ncbi:MAG: hypothetical protein ACI9N1_001319 [Flavobacteriales bacterium]|jgi:hypothetical protein
MNKIIIPNIELTSAVCCVVLKNGDKHIRDKIRVIH